MKVAFVLPAIGKKPGERYIGTWKMEPLTIAMLSALTPPDVEQVFFDDRIELIDYDHPTDVVAITVETYTAKRAYAIADRFAARGVKVVLGGYHATLLPEEAAAHADAIVTGNAEAVWAQVMDDLKSGSLRPRYNGGVRIDDTPPDRTIFGDKNYLPVGLVETGRGCGHFCEFCAIASYYRARYHPRALDRVVRDIEVSGRKVFFFVDDNLVADPDNVLELCRRLKSMNVMWAAQGTLEMAARPDLLRAMKDAGCELILIGFESLEPASLAAMGKRWSVAGGERAEMVKRIHDAGIGIYATFVLGYDGDTRETFGRTVEFAKESAFHTAAFNHLLPFPGTRLYARLEAEGRLLSPTWWLDEDYHYGQLAFRPAKLAPEEVSGLCRQARKDFGAPGSVFVRGMHAFSRGRLRMWPVFWMMNLRLGREIEEKYDIPIGAHLDELPK
ncbi:MAG: radical SAM protein [Actinomycetales bacterium]|nr:MAG: radical SAM protein [Actinomycetales bacterium]